jgi:hypothetical protein
MGMTGSSDRSSGGAGPSKNKVVCPACGSLNAAIVEDKKSGITQRNRDFCCADCGRIFHVTRKRKEVSENHYGKASRASGSSRDVWIIRLLFGMAVVGAIALALGIRYGMARATAPKPEQSIRPVQSPPEEKSRQNPTVAKALAEADAALSSEDKEIRSFLGGFLGASNWRERLPMVRNPTQAAPRMSEYYKTHNDGAFDNLLISPNITRSGNLIVFSLQGENLPSRKLIVEQRDKSYLVDWESFVLWQEKPWKDISKSSVAAEIRCLIKPLPNNHPVLGDKDGWLAFELLNPVTREIAFAFLKKDSQSAPKSPRATLERGSAGPITLSVRKWDGEGSQNEWLIEHVLSLGWVHPLPEGHRKP